MPFPLGHVFQTHFRSSRTKAEKSDILYSAMQLHLNCGKNCIIHTTLPAFIMGVINATPDSFYENSRAVGVKKGLERALTLEKEGADIIDIGGESTRPGSSYISEEEELERVIPVIEAVRKHSAIPISVDTRKLIVMKAAFKAGANLCNDISALTDEPALGHLIAEELGAVILMHKQGIPPTMQENVHTYKNVVSEVQSYLQERIQYARRCGIAREQIIIDYGIGFGKTVEDNYRLVAASKSFTDLGYPLLVGLSRKSFIGAVTGGTAEKRLTGTLAATMYAVQHGASVVRVHDVDETRQMLLVLKELQRYGAA